MIEPKDPMYKDQWNLQLLNVPKAWELTKGENVVVGIIDSGIDYSHKDLGCEQDIQIMAYDSLTTIKRKCVDVFMSIQAETHPKILPGWNFIADEAFTWDAYRHGTYMAGLIGADRDEFGIIGVAPNCKIRPYAILDDNGRTRSGLLEQAINKAVDDGCQVINISLGFPTYSSHVYTAIGKAIDAGIIVVASMGNSNRETKQYPAGYTGVIAVGACGGDKGRWVFSDTRGSNWGKHIACLCPGDSQPTTRRLRSRHGVVDATSAATANMSGIATLVKSVDPDIAWDDMLSLIADHSSASEWDETVGWGVPDAYEMVSAAKTDDAPVSNKAAELLRQYSETLRLMAADVNRLANELETE